MELTKAIQERYSCKNFSSKKPNWRTIIECIDSARFAPMAGNTFSLKFILIDDSEKIQKLAEASQQSFIKNAHFVVAVLTHSFLTENAFEERGKKYLQQQAGAAIQNILLKITEAGLSTCWVGHFVDEQVKEILGVPESIEIEALLPIGYELKKSKTRKAKINLDAVLYFNKYKNKNMMNIKKIDV